MTGPLEQPFLFSVEKRGNGWILRLTHGRVIILPDHDRFRAIRATASAGLENLSRAKAGTLCVMLDLAEHLRRGGRPLRLLRDMINTFDKTGLTIVLIDGADTLPDVIKSHATPFELSYPDEKELSQIVRATIQTIHRKRPIDVGISRSGFDAVVLWIDEIEKAFASAASRNVDGGLSQRMFGTLLTWLQEHTAPVFVVATANDIEALPPELLRKGRFDEIFFVDLPTLEVRREIFSIHLNKRGRQPDRFDLDVLAQAAEGYSGAEIEQAILAALCRTFADKAELDTDRMVSALGSSPPLSVTLAERVQALRQWARGRCVPAD